MTKSTGRHTAPHASRLASSCLPGPPLLSPTFRPLARPVCSAHLIATGQPTSTLPSPLDSSLQRHSPLPCPTLPRPTSPVCPSLRISDRRLNPTLLSSPLHSPAQPTSLFPSHRAIATHRTSTARPRSSRTYTYRLPEPSTCPLAPADVSARPLARQSATHRRPYSSRVDPALNDKPGPSGSASTPTDMPMQGNPLHPTTTTRLPPAHLSPARQATSLLCCPTHTTTQVRKQELTMTSIFASFTNKAWPHRFHGTIRVRNLAGGVPTDPKVAEGWLKTKLADKDDLIREAVAQTMVERGVTADEAAKLVDTNKHLNGFKRDENGLYIEGRQLKAAIKEAASVARSVDKLKSRWGSTNKGVQGFVAEHIMVVEDVLHLGVDAPTSVLQSFPKNPRTGQTGIQYTEIVESAEFSFTVISDYAFTDEEWAMLWLTGEQQGVGASRSQGFGRYEVIKWEPGS